MGSSIYSSSSRAVRATDTGYYTKSVNELFSQQKARRIHKDMDPCDVEFREARDSENHPNTVPIQLYLDVTGSMGQIPHMLIKDGLPKLISRIIQAGIPDVALMFGAIGDHECDEYPLQVAQFESGDEELDMWLTRTYLEGGGGGNAGESYALAWYFAANHIRTDAKDKRGKKGFVFTIGDEPFLYNIPANALKSLMGKACQAQGLAKANELYEAACQDNHVFHIHVNHRGRKLFSGWRDLMGQNVIEVDDYEKIPEVIAKLVIAHTEQEVKETVYVPSKEEMIL